VSDLLRVGPPDPQTEMVKDIILNDTPPREYENCPRCGGAGDLEIPGDLGTTSFGGSPETVPCGTCSGSGIVYS
jgi:hypothetical protein